MVHMEEELGEALPYWDWTEDGRVPSLWEDIQTPIQQGADYSVVGVCSGEDYTSQDPETQVNSKELKESTCLAKRNLLRKEEMPVTS